MIEEIEAFVPKYTEEGRVEVSKIVILGLTGLNYDLVDRWLDELPNLGTLQSEGIWGKLRGSVPPSIPAAWTCAQSSRNPGVFGFWDFAYRDDFSYGEPRVINCTTKDQRVGCLYNILHRSGQKVAVVNVPVTWPPPRIPGGYSISSVTGPGPRKGFTWPKSLADELPGLVGEYILDAYEPWRSDLQMERGRVLKSIYEMDLQRFALLRYFVARKQCDCVLTVVTGAHRIGHLFYHFFDERHRRYHPGSRYSNVIKDYYTWIDKQIGEVREILLEDTALFVISDHGVGRLDGVIHLNEWLAKEGYLVLRENPSKPTPFGEIKTDWAKTRVWATGSAGQVYINLKGRESEGTVDRDQYEGLLDELISKLKKIPDEKGNPLRTRVFKRHEIYSGPYASFAPDLFVFFDECRWKTSDWVGLGSGHLYSLETSLAQDAAGDMLDGYFCLGGPRIPAKGEYADASLLDIAPTVLDVMDLEIPKEMEGLSISGKERTPEEEESLVHERLKFLGY